MILIPDLILTARTYPFLQDEAHVLYMISPLRCILIDNIQKCQRDSIGWSHLKTTLGHQVYLLEVSCVKYFDCSTACCVWYCRVHVQNSGRVPEVEQVRSFVRFGTARIQIQASFSQWDFWLVMCIVRTYE